MTGTNVSSTHPLLPPTTEDDRVAWLRLLRSRRVGTATFYRLMGEHGRAQKALAALPEIAAQAGVKNYAPCSEAAARKELARGGDHGADMLFYGEADYPPLLAALPDAPPILWIKGRRDLLTHRAVSLVGARNASSLGTRMAKSLAEGLGKEGLVVVSGLARGVDTAAHLAALETGTIAVLAGGVDIYYPSENTLLAEDIAARGLLISEQPLGLAPMARHFPARNRIISGLSAATVVVEAAGRSGSLITARDALDQGREVLAVPGHPFDARSAGCNMLIRDGARLVRSAKDVMEVLGSSAQLQLNLPDVATPETSSPRPAPRKHPAPPKEAPSLRDIAALHRDILSRLGPSPVAEDQVLRDLGLSPQVASPILVDLEMSGQLDRHPGGLLALPPQ